MGVYESMPPPHDTSGSQGSWAVWSRGKGAVVWGFRGKTAGHTEPEKLVFGKQV